MKNILKNFWVTLTRFKVASVLNLLGLSVAFAVFAIVMTQLRWEVTFNSTMGDGNVYQMYTHSHFDNKYSPSTSPKIVEAIASANPNIESYALHNYWREHKLNTTQNKENSVNVSFFQVSSDFPKVFSMVPLEGDFDNFVDKSIIIYQSVKQGLFGEGSAAGEIVEVGGEPYTIAAVIEDLPRNTFLHRAKGLINLGDLSDVNIGYWNHQVFFKLRAGADTTAFAGTEKVVREVYPYNLTSQEDLGGKPLVQFENTNKMYFSDYSPQGDKTFSIILFAIAVLIIIVALINYLNFFMSLAPTRIKAVNINKVFGAPIAALRANVIFEGVFFMVVSFAISLLFIHIAADNFIGEMLQASLEIGQNIDFLSLLLCVAILLGAVVALFPSLYITSFAPALLLRGSFGRSRRGVALRRGLSVFQFIISFTIATASLFIVVQNNYLKDYDYGFEREGIIISYTPSGVYNNWDSFKSEMLSNPKILSVTRASSHITTTGLMLNGMRHKDRELMFQNITGDKDFMKTHKIRIIEGSDTTSNTKGRALIINATAAREFELKVGDQLSDGRAEVVAIMQDFNNRPLNFAIEPMFISMEDGYDGYSITFRTAKGVSLKDAKEIISSTMDKFPSEESDSEYIIHSLDEHISELYYMENKTSKLIALFAVVVFIISLMGVFGMVLFDMQYRRREIALRKIYGSRTLGLLARFNRPVVITLLVSFAVSVPLSWYAIDRWLEGFAYRTPMHVWVFVVVMVVLTATVVGIVSVQCYSVIRSNPVKYLKSE